MSGFTPETPVAQVPNSVPPHPPLSSEDEPHPARRVSATPNVRSPTASYYVE
jgi:hypothetical protein